MHRAQAVYVRNKEHATMRQSVQTQMHEVHTESIDIPGTQLPVARVALGTWAMGAVGGLAAQDAGDGLL
jgi:hypothetical protein